jgi:serine/threonine protein kinase
MSIDGFWDSSPEARTSAEFLIGQRLGPYKLLRALGRGGMGDVYLAERDDDQYRQQVAIKLVRGGFISPHVQGRLRIERQILASLQHPNIARLLDGGTAPDDTPYLVMEYIEGEPIDVYCNRHKLSVEERLELFRTVCSAVHCAHQNLVVHRDLKPSNIMVTPDGVPKLLDFGIAKLLDSRGSMHTLAVTHVDYRMMTPAHASPEQVRGENITTASDIYVLGVLLYDLLTGQRPFELRSSRLADLERIICEQPALAPSEAVERARRDAPGLAEEHATCRSTSVARLRKRLSGDLDNIVLMSMRKEPQRRYSSVEQMSSDVDRHLQGLPVIATRDTWRYRTGKFVARHAFGVGAGAVLAILLSTFAAAILLQSQRVARQRDIAAQERARAEQVSAFLVDIFNVSNPSESRGNEIKVREVLDRGAQRVQTELSAQPATQASLLDAIGRVYLSLGLTSLAEPLLSQALEIRQRLYPPSNPIIASSLGSMGEAMRAKGELDAAEKLLRQALAINEKFSGADSAPVADNLHQLGVLLKMRGQYSAAEHALRASLDILRRRPVSMNTGSAMNELAQVLVSRGDYAGAEQLYRGALSLATRLRGKDDPEYAYQLHDLAMLLQLKGETREAEVLFSQSLQLYRKLFGPEHPETISALNNFGWFLAQTGRLDEAEQTLSQCLMLDRKVHGPVHAFVGYDLASLGSLYARKNDFAAARNSFQEALTIYAKTLPADHPYVASALTGLGELLADRKEYAAEAQRMLERAVAIWRKERTDGDVKVANAKSALGRALSMQGHYAEAEPLLTASFPILLGNREPDSPERIAKVKVWLEDLYTAWGQPQRAAAFLSAQQPITPAVARMEVPTPFQAGADAARPSAASLPAADRP